MANGFCKGIQSSYADILNNTMSHDFTGAIIGVVIIKKMTCIL